MEYIVKSINPSRQHGTGRKEFSESIQNSISFVGNIKNFANDPKLFGQLQPDRKTLIIDYSYLKDGIRIVRQFVGEKQ